MRPVSIGTLSQRLRYPRLSLSLLIAGVVAAPPAQAQIGQQPLLVTVGSDAACDRTALADALSLTAANAGRDFIRIAKNHRDTAIAVRIVNQQVTIEGGFDSCTDSTPSGQTILDGTGGSAASVIEIAFNPQPTPFQPDVVLQNLLIRGGEDDAGENDLGGGGLDISVSGKVRLVGVTVRENESLRGGGIVISGSNPGFAQLEIEQGSVVAANNALEGGGIYCAQGIVELTETQVAGNRAKLGGGVVATLECEFLVGPMGPGDGVLSNDAEQGGGIFANRAASVELVGDETGPARVASNRALDGDVRRGGGVYATEAGTEVVARNAHILSNSSGQPERGGGGIYLDEGAFLRMERRLFGTCHTVDRCSSLSGNLGGALAVVGNSTAEIYNTYIEGNAPLDPGGATIEVEGSLQAEGIVMAGNGPGGLVDSLGDLRFAYTTFADNLPNDSSPTPLLEARGAFALHSSLIAESTSELFAIVGTADVDCLIVNDASGIPAGTRIEENDIRPFFVDADGGDYHLLPTPSNPAIDFCDDSVAAPAARDIDLEPRGVDIASIGEEFLNEFWDLGADEVQVVPELDAGRLDSLPWW